MRVRKYGIISIALILFVIRDEGRGEGRGRGLGARRPLPELKLINGERKINGAENTTSPALILRGKVATRVFQGRVQKEIVSAPFLTVRT